MPQRTGARRRLGSIRLSLILVALVPSVTLAAMWGVTTTQMFSEGLRLRAQTELSRSTGSMGTQVTLALQRERGLSALWLAARNGPPAALGVQRENLDAQRKRTDRVVADLVGQSDAIREAPARVRDRLYSFVASAGSLAYYRRQVDDPTDITAVQALDQYGSIINAQIHAFEELSQVDDGDLTSQATPLVALAQAAELISEEDVRLTLAAPAGHMDETSWNEFARLVNARRWLVQDQILPSLNIDTKRQTKRILRSAAWRSLESVEDRVLAARASSDKNRPIPLPDVRERWRASAVTLSGQYADLIGQQTADLLERGTDEARGLLVTAAFLSAGGLAALVVCAGMSWRITRSLSRRLRGLRVATLGLAEERLPDVVARLDRGERVDAEVETPPLDYGEDELGQVAKAFNTAQRTAVHTAVELADIRRGFRKVILGIARESQNLVNLQLSKLDLLERQQTDPDILRSLYELDSTASQLRRYEENLVIISGERPGRSWSEPVALIDILRGAVGEVAEYQRVSVRTEQEVSLVPPAVADVIHLLAELIDNATVYSPAPSPVEVSATLVAKGLAIEVEDRGLGMTDEEYASINAQLAVEPQFDVVALADDLRLGMFVIARLATRHGVTVTLRPSPYGGTTAIVLVPHGLVVRESLSSSAPPAPPVLRALSEKPDEPDEKDTGQTIPLARRTGRARHAKPAWHAKPALSAPPALSTAPAPAATPAPAQAPATTGGVRHRPPWAAGAPRRGGTAGTGRGGGPAPLPRRVPQTSLVLELRGQRAPAEENDVPPGAPDDRAAFTAERAASSLAGFQRGTLRARDGDADAGTRHDRAAETATALQDPESAVPAAAERPAPAEQPDPAPRLRPPTADHSRRTPT